MKLPKGMEVEVFAKKAIAGIEAGKLEVRPGLAYVMKILSQIAPEFTLKQVAKMIPLLGLQSQIQGPSSLLPALGPELRRKNSDPLVGHVQLCPVCFAIALTSAP